MESFDSKTSLSSIVDSDAFMVERSRSALAEGKARAVLERRTGHAIGDAEWSRIKTKLVEFCTILLGWEQDARGKQRKLKAS
jgi:hypothetical protein